MLVFVLGLFAGALTTVAGLGGGMLLVLVLSVVWDPHRALAVTAPALLFGNAHRLFLFRRALDRRVALRLALGAVPASFAAGLAMVEVPAVVLHVLLVAMTLLAAARELKLIRFGIDRALVAVGLLAGGLTATTGGGGLLVAPTLRAAGLVGERYVATGAAVAIAMHVGRIGGYSGGGLIDAATLLDSALLGAAILFGNLLGRRLHAHMEEPAKARMTYAVLVTSIGLALLGLR